MHRAFDPTKAVTGKASPFFRFVAQLENLQFADHVGRRLAGINHVAFNLRGFNAVIDCLLPRPVFRMQAGIDNKPPGAEFFKVELAEQAFDIIFVPPRPGLALRS